MGNLYAVRLLLLTVMIQFSAEGDNLLLVHVAKGRSRIYVADQEECLIGTVHYVLESCILLLT